MILDPFAVLLLGALLAGFIIVVSMLCFAFGVGLWLWRILGRFAEIKLARVASTVKLESTLGQPREKKPKSIPLKREHLS